MKPACALVVVGLLLALSGDGLIPARAGEAPSNSAKAGWAEVDITPPLGIALGGRGGPKTPATKVLDPLYAQVLYLRDANGKGFVLASFDLIGLPHDLSDRIRTSIAQELGVEWDLIVLNASHTHSGPYMIRSLIAGVGPPPQIEVDYFKALEEKMVTATRAAAKALKPVEVEVFQGTSRLGINRRGTNEQGHAAMVPNDQNPIDDKLWVMKLTPGNGQPSAVVFSYACHAVIVYGYAYSAISADFPGATRNVLRDALGAKAHLQFVQGFAGNIRPRATADLENHRFHGARPETLREAAKDLADAVLNTMKSTGQTLALDIAGAADRPFLPRGKPPARAVYEKMRKTALTTTNEFRLSLSDYWLKRYDAGEGFARGDVWSLGLIRLAGNQWIVHSGGEPCVEWRPKMNQWLAVPNLVTWGYCQEARAYLPTEALLPEGGYEVLDSNYARASTPAPFTPGIERIVKESLLRQLACIRGKRD